MEGIKMNIKEFEPIFSRQISGLPIRNYNRKPMRSILQEEGITSL